MNTTAARIRQFREQAKISQESLARDVDVSLNTVRNWVHGVSEPSAGNLVRLARALGTDPNTLLGWNASPEE